MIILLGLNDTYGITTNILRTLCGWLCEFIYPLIARVYKIFMEIGKLFYTEEFSEIYNKISLIIGIFMVFRVTFWLIEMLVNPDMITDKEKNAGNLIKKVLVSIVLLAITPRIFEYAAEIQYEIVNQQIIERIILPSNSPADSEQSGKSIAADLFINFYTMNDPSEHTGVNQTVVDNCEIFAPLEDKSPNNTIIYEDLLQYGRMNLTNNCLTARFSDDQKDKKSNYSDYIINFNGIFAVAVGVFVLLMLIMYCISLGTRYAQLIFLQIIAPIPIMCYLTPKKDNMFSKWIKQCTTTYLDLFIRVGIISFTLFLVKMILSNDSTVLNEIGASGASNEVVIFLVLGLLTFAKKAPDLVQELLPKSLTKASGDFGLSLKKRAESMVGGKFMYSTLKRAPGYVAGGVVGGLVGGYLGAKGGKGFGSRLAGGISGATRGFATGSKKGSIFKNVGDVRKNQAAYNNKLQQWRIAAGKGENDPNTIGDYFSRVSAGWTKNSGFETRGEARERDTKYAKSAASTYKSAIDFGTGKALEKRTGLKAFGKSHNIAELKAFADQAKTEADNITVDKLLTTPTGISNIKARARRTYMENEKQKLIESGYTEEQAKLDMQNRSKGLNDSFEKHFNSMSEYEKQSLAEEEKKALITKALEAESAYDDAKKEAGFTYLVEAYADGKAQNVVNDFEYINEFLDSHPEIASKYGLEKSDDGKYFDAKEMNELRLKAESDSNDTETQKARDDFKKIFNAFERFKGIESEYEAENRKAEYKRDQANDKFNGGK